MRPVRTDPATGKTGCPFCGFLSKFSPRPHQLPNEYWQLECGACGADGPPAKTKDAAYERWNTRAPSKVSNSTGLESPQQVEKGGPYPLIPSEAKRSAKLKELTAHLPEIPSDESRPWVWSDKEIEMLRAACAKRFGETLRTESLFCIAATGIRIYLSRVPQQAAGDVVKALQNILNGLDSGLVRIETDADETWAHAIAQARKALSTLTPTKPISPAQIAKNISGIGDELTRHGKSFSIVLPAQPINKMENS